MQALVIYESMYGNTHPVANHIAEGLRTAFDVTVLPVGGATLERLQAADLIVCGGPTHAHGMSSEYSRNAAATAANKEGSALSLEPAAYGPGLRDWFKTVVPPTTTKAVPFDTRIDAPAFFTGRASKGISRRLHEHGFEVVFEPESFLVDQQNDLLDGEAERAEAWGAALADAAVAQAGRR